MKLEKKTIEVHDSAIDVTDEELTWIQKVLRDYETMRQFLLQRTKVKD